MTLTKYLFKRFFATFLVALLFFVAGLVLVDLFLNLWSYIAHGASVAKVFLVSLLYVPKSLSFAMPLAVLFSVAYVLSDLYSKNELPVIFASGISLMRFTSPLLIFALFLSVFSFFFEDRVVTKTYHQKESLQDELQLNIKSKSSSDLVILAQGGKVVYKALLYDDLQKCLYDLYIVYRDDQKKVTSIVRADNAKWNGEKWILTDFARYVVKEDSVYLSYDLSDLSLTEFPETFQKIDISVEEVSILEAKNYINYLKRSALPTAAAYSEYYKKFSFPFVCFIVVFLSIGLTGRTKKNVLLVSLALCSGAAVSFYILQMVTMLLSQFEYISPVFGAWFPVILYILISCVLIRFTRT